MNSVIASDLFRHFGLKGTKGFLKGLSYPGFRYTYILRKVSQHHKGSLSEFFYKLLLRRYRYKYGFEINPDANIGEGFYLTSHCSPVIIGPIKMGKNCNVSHSVTIGRGIAGERKGRPTLGDYVWIGPGSIIVGKITIGNDVLIAPNTFVNFDVPDHSIVIGSPGKIITKENPTKDYIHFTVQSIPENIDAPSS
ncbi:MAG: transferase hexapeptide repeat containing protein [Bacteroidetes bacterium]|jgi:serine O-acetyltransferase|nr:transferase hexapeptide repeat containing protein [Bacteroidota bacterium]